MSLGQVGRGRLAVALVDHRRRAVRIGLGFGVHVLAVDDGHRHLRAQVRQARGGPVDDEVLELLVGALEHRQRHLVQHLQALLGDGLFDEDEMAHRRARLGQVVQQRGQLGAHEHRLLVAAAALAFDSFCLHGLRCLALGQHHVQLPPLRA
ncbi:MAG: hypothetical protein U1F25_12340 [Rubrivivax sp.]